MSVHVLVSQEGIVTIIFESAGAIRFISSILRHQRNDACKFFTVVLHCLIFTYTLALALHNIHCGFRYNFASKAYFTVCLNLLMFIVSLGAKN